MLSNGLVLWGTFLDLAGRLVGWFGAIYLFLVFGVTGVVYIALAFSCLFRSRSVKAWRCAVFPCLFRLVLRRLFLVFTVVFVFLF